MNRKTMKMLVTGKKPRLSSSEKQHERDTRLSRPGGRTSRSSKLVFIEPIKLDPTLSKYIDAYANLREVILTRHLLR